MNEITELISKEIVAYGHLPSADVVEKIRLYISILLRWNEKVSLTTILEPREMIRFHFGESMFGLTSGMIHGGRLADVGSGAGLPGIPLHLASPEVKVTLIESNLKKCAFLGEIVRKLKVERDVRIWHGRMEEFDCEYNPYDYITARAVGDIGSLLSFAKNNLNQRGRIVLWMGEEDSMRVISEHSEEWIWSGLTRIPKSKRRHLLSGQRR